ncbi:glycosyl hydrolase family 43 [Aquimarina sp. BL5]|uniref:family 43 glycosylhydrolase n=1 Tax=Aquimarina sp. BL5 TaxID=1714860 RepID=UPI000E53EB14|nr:family 43 glycosylhydrolase [Aquimarina sp. BL5]AXT50217.1 glycosyl hydrolase family 43 [Aquimarina sp. BL5]RKN09537.1 carbohydrate-binding protein [Aquimarina sp. BL5]
MKKFIPILVFICFTHVAISQNPLITHMHTADPTARVFNDKLYIYPSHDAIPPEGIKAPRFCMPDYHIFSLENGNTWKDNGVILDQNEVPWGKKNSYGMWAPDCIERDGKYYYYYPAPPNDGTTFRRIGVGVSKSPTGPFTWEKDYIKGIDGIDPGLMIDDDGQAYIFFAGGKTIKGAKLNKNMKQIDGDAIKIQGIPAGYVEGPFPFKYNGTYYLTFAHVFPDEGYTIAYATSKSPLGPYVYSGKIMDNIDNGTNHHSVVKYKGKWILFYHWWSISGYSKLRSMRADYMEFKDDGTIKKVKPTLRGIGNPTINDTIQIDRYNSIQNAKTTFVGGNEPNGWMVSDTKMMSNVRFNGVDFGEGKATKIQARVASGQRNGSFEIHLGGAKGQLIATFPVNYTGGYNTWETIETDIIDKPTGLQDITVVFKSVWGATKIVNLNWLLLKE